MADIRGFLPAMYCTELNFPYILHCCCNAKNAVPVKCRLKITHTLTKHKHMNGL